jgi:hypothetical protein
VTGRCQRCGSGCEDPLCPACQAFVAALQRLLKTYPAADPQHRKPGRQAADPAVVVETFKAVGSLQLHRLGRRARFYCVTCMEYKRGDLVATTRGDWKQAVCDRCYAALVKPQGKAKKKAPKRTRQPSKTVRHEQLKRRNGPPAEPATAKGQSKRKRKGKGKKGEKAPPSQSTHHGIFTEYHAPRAPRWSPRVFGRNRPPSDLG